MDARPRGRPPQGDRALTRAEIQKRWRERVAKINQRRDDILAKIAEISTDPVARKMAEMALKREG